MVSTHKATFLFVVAMVYAKCVWLDKNRLSVGGQTLTRYGNRLSL